MKRIVMITLVVLVILGAFGFAFRQEATFLAMSLMLTPGDDWHAADAPPAPDYADAGAWAAMPGKVDNADFTVGDEQDGQTTAEVDVFFVYPTTHYSSDSWNAALDNVDANRFMERGVLRGQASAFNACCRIHVPLYRQATLAAFFELDDRDNKESIGEQALNLAYSDVAMAFRQFIENIGDGPFMLAGHSQGSAHLQRLVREEVSRTPLKDRLIAVYAIGYWWNRKDLAETPDIPVCTSATQTGCLVTWNAVGPKATSFQDISDQICVNPLSWSNNDAVVPHDNNQGSLVLGDLDKNTPAQLLTGVADARCTGGRLLVSEVRTDAFGNSPISFGDDNYHILDYALFYLNLRRNAVERVDAYQTLQDSEPDDEPENSSADSEPPIDEAPEPDLMT